MSRSKLSKRQGVHFHKKFGVDRAPQSVESVTKYSFAKFKEIFAKLRSKLSVCVVLTEKIVGTSPIFGLDRSATHFFTKNFRWADYCAHAFRGIRYLVFLWNEMWYKSEIW